MKNNNIKEQIHKRGTELFKLDMGFNGDSYIGMHDFNADFNVHHTEISLDTEDVWDTKIKKLQKEYNKRKKV